MPYEISIDRVVENFSAIAGEDAVSCGRVFCLTSAETLTGWLNSSCDLQGFDCSVCYAAACMAYYRFVINSTKNSSDIKAGDITVKDNSETAVNGAKALMDNALMSISQLLKSKRFAFKRTGGGI